MVSQAVVDYARKGIQIDSRYLNQGRYHEKDYTPKQKRRMRKQRNKWRKRLLGR